MKSNHFKCIGYFFSRPGADLEKLRFDVLTHVNFAFAIPTREGHVLPLEHPEQVRAVVERTHQAGAKVCLSLGGWSYQDIPLEATFREATDSPEKITCLAREIVAMAEAFGFDGVDVDWEYPRRQDGSKEQYEAFIAQLHDLLKPKGMLLTAAVLAGLDSRFQPIQSAALAQDWPSFEKLDWLNLMTYDCDGEKHSTYEFAEKSVDYWVNTRGFTPEKLNLGLPFYGRPFPGDYRLLLAADPDALEKDMVQLDGQQVWYNGRDTLQKKVALAKKAGLGGVMIWEVTQDADDESKSLLTALGQVL